MRSSLTVERIELHATPPFRLDLTVWALRRRRHNAVDWWDGEQYRRVVVVGETPVRLVVTQRPNRTDPILDVGVGMAHALGSQEIEEIASLVGRTFGLTTDLGPFYELARNDDHLKFLADRFSGVKPPRFPSIFEALVNAIACQQVTLDLGILLLNRLAERFGASITDRGIPQYAFPLAGALSDASVESIKELGFSRHKARAIKELAQGVADGTLNLGRLEGLADEDAVEFLSSIRGIGRWSAEYVLLRGLGRIDTFPGDDIGAQNNLRRLFHLDDRPSYETIGRLTSVWHPFEGLVYFHLLLEKLRQAHAIRDGSSGPDEGDG